MRTKSEILEIMKKAYEDDSYMLVGEQLIGPSDFPEDMFKRYRESSGGEMPAILGLDLGIYGMDLLRTGIGTEKWNKFVSQSVNFAEIGGIITASHHWDNPSAENLADCKYCRGMFGDGTEKYWDELLKEGSEINKKFKNDLITGGMFLKELDAKGIPVLYRPLHEANGSWFWFTARSCGSKTWISADYLIKLWRYIYNIYVNEMEMKNLIWVYSPNVCNMLEYTKDTLYYYPGDEYVDMVGIDWYTNGENEFFNEHRSYDKIMSFGKPFAICEFGPGKTKSLFYSTGKHGTAEEQMKLFSSVDALNLLKDVTVNYGVKCAYMLTWHVGFGAFSGLGLAKEALSDPFFCTLDRLNNICKNR